MQRRLLTCFITAACALWICGSGARDAAAAERRVKQTAGREVLVVWPDSPRYPLPLVLALHGCDQSPSEFLAATGLEALADREGFALALPAARAAVDNPLGCWRWWDPEQQRRDGEEPRFLRDVVRSMGGDIDPQRVYAVGFSSGGAMTAVLAAVYPDVFAAVGIHSGIGFAAAANAPCALDVMDDGPGRSRDRGTLAYLHQSIHRIVPALIIHGGDDDVVHPDHAAALVRETAQRNDWIDNGEDDDSFDDEADARRDDPGPCVEDNCYPHRVQRFEDRDGDATLVSVRVEGLGHDWSGGAAGHRYADPHGPDAAAMVWQFFWQHRLNADTLETAVQPECRDWWAAPWWHVTWGGTMSLAEYTCNMNPWRVVWRHQIEGIHGPGRCP